MTREELVEAAKIKVIKILGDNGVKIRFNEICFYWYDISILKR